MAKHAIKKTQREMDQIIKMCPVKAGVVYAVERDVVNPFGDRRIRDDWRQEPLFVEGTRFYPEMHEGKIRLAGPAPGDLYLTVTDPLYYEILPALVEAAPSVTDVLRTNGFIDPVRVLDALVENKVLSMENLMFGIELIKEVDARLAKENASADGATPPVTTGPVEQTPMPPTETTTTSADKPADAKPGSTGNTGNTGNNRGNRRNQNQASA